MFFNILSSDEGKVFCDWSMNEIKLPKHIMILRYFLLHIFARSDCHYGVGCGPGSIRLFLLSQVVCNDLLLVRKNLIFDLTDCTI